MSNRIISENNNNNFISNSFLADMESGLEFFNLSINLQCHAPFSVEYFDNVLLFDQHQCLAIDLL